MTLCAHPHCQQPIVADDDDSDTWFHLDTEHAYCRHVPGEAITFATPQTVSS